MHTIKDILVVYMFKKIIICVKRYMTITQEFILLQHVFDYKSSQLGFVSFLSNVSF